MSYLVDAEAIFYLPSGKRTKNDGTSQFVMGQLTISMAIFISKLLVYQRVVPNTCCPRYFFFFCLIYIAWWAGLDEEPRLQVDFRASSAGASVTLKWACSIWRCPKHRGTPNHQNPGSTPSIESPWFGDPPFKETPRYPLVNKHRP